MPSILPFNNAVINSTAVEQSNFIPGSGTYIEQGDDIVICTRDGMARHIRQAVFCKSTFTLFGDFTLLANSAGTGIQCILKHNSTVISEFTGHVTAVYNAAKAKTFISILGHPI